MPTIRFGKVRRMLRSGKAKVVQRKPFTIKLEYESTEHVQPLNMGVDTGSSHIGVSVTKEDGEPILLATLETRTKDVADGMKVRQMHRSARRRNLRDKKKRRAKKAGTVFTEKKYKISGCDKEITCKLIKPGKIRFQNRKRPEGWFTPTANHLFDTHVNFIRKVSKILPITSASIEYAKFDIQKIDNPEITGKEYQNGRKQGHTNTSEYVLCRDKHTCQMCGKKTGSMNVHHVKWRTDGGSDVPENLICLCEKCHDKAHKNTRFDKKVKETFEGLKKRYEHTTLLNSIMPKLYEWLKANFQTVSKVYGYQTKDKRREFDLPKKHWIDAYLVSLGDIKPHDVSNYEPFYFKQFRRHNRAVIQRQEDRKYYIGKKKVANNRGKRTGQKGDSLKELVTKKGESILNKLTVKPATRPKRSSKPFGMGDVISFKGQVFTVKKGVESALIFNRL